MNDNQEDLKKIVYRQQTEIQILKICLKALVEAVESGQKIEVKEFKPGLSNVVKFRGKQKGDVRL